MMDLSISINDLQVSYHLDCSFLTRTLEATSEERIVFTCPFSSALDTGVDVSGTNLSPLRVYDEISFVFDSQR